MLLPGTAHATASSGIQPLPVIELKEKSATTPSTTPATTPSTVKPTTISVVTIPTADIPGDEGDSGDDAAVNDDASTSKDTDAPISAKPVSNGSAESSSNLATTGADVARLVGIGMVLTAIGIAVLGFTDARARTERFVLSLLPNRISGK